MPPRFLMKICLLRRPVVSNRRKNGVTSTPKDRPRDPSCDRRPRLARQILISLALDFVTLLACCISNNTETN